MAIRFGMKMMLRMATSVGLLAWTTFVFGDVRQTLEDYVSQFKSLTANFDQTVINEKGKTTETSSGEVYLQRPGKFHWEYLKPYEQSIVGDGKKVWVYDKDLEQVTVRRVEQALRSAPALILSSDAKLDENFTVSDDGEKEGIAWATLTPKDAKNEYSKVRVGFEGKALRWMELFDNFGQTTRLKFSGEDLNGMLDDKVFSFAPPAGVDVNDLTAEAPKP
jgi:outer membrane lipoprotein carrier protein